MVLSALYQAIYVPFDLFFVETTRARAGGLDEGRRVWAFLDALEVVTEVVFYMDLVLGFFVCYFDKTIGEFIWKPKLIVKRYLKGKFFVNFLATLHW